MKADSAWICTRLVRKMLNDADLFNKQTPRALMDRVASGLLPVRAKRVTYSSTPLGVARETLLNPIAWSEIIHGLGDSEINFDDRTIKNSLVRGWMRPMWKFIAFDVEFGRAAILDFIGPKADAKPIITEASAQSVADTQPNASEVSSARSGRRPGDGAFHEVDARFVDEIVALRITKHVTSTAEGARKIWEQYHTEIKGTQSAAVSRLSKAANAKLRQLGHR